jgi:hypothetical protein
VPLFNNGYEHRANNPRLMKTAGWGTHTDPCRLAASQINPSSQPITMAEFSVKTVSSRDAQTMLRSHRAGRGGRTSKFHPVLDEVKNTRKGQIVTVEGVPKNQVQTLRSFVYRHLNPEEWTVKSAREKGRDSYAIAIGRTSDFE